MDCRKGQNTQAQQQQEKQNRTVVLPYRPDRCASLCGPAGEVHSDPVRTRLSLDGMPVLVSLSSFYQIASSEVELGTPIPEEEYLSGRVFVGSIAAAAPAAPTAPPKQITTPFARLKASSAARSSGADSALPAAALAALLADPLALLLNRDGVTRGERAVVVDTFLSKQLRTHQRDGVEFMYRCVMGIVSPHHEGCILADEMGLGKTLQAITLLYTLLHYSPTKPKGECSKAIVVCPATLLNNWNKEFTKWLGSHRLRPVVLAARSHTQHSTQHTGRRIHR